MVSLGVAQELDSLPTGIERIQSSSERRGNSFFVHSLSTSSCCLYAE